MTTGRINQVDVSSPSNLKSRAIAYTIQRYVKTKLKYFQHMKRFAKWQSVQGITCIDTRTGKYNSKKAQYSSPITGSLHSFPLHAPNRHHHLSKKYETQECSSRQQCQFTILALHKSQCSPSATAQPALGYIMLSATTEEVTATNRVGRCINTGTNRNAPASPQKHCANHNAPPV